MNWKRWKMGLLVSLISGLFTGLLSAAANLTLKQTLIMVVAAIAKDGQLYLVKHPVEEIQETSMISKSDVQPVKTNNI